MSWATHASAVTRLRESYTSVPAGAPVRLAKGTSNLFRPRAARSAPGLDVSGLDDVIEVDSLARTADVAGMCTYESLVAATLAHGLSPLVVPQLKTITLGGAVTGLGIESTSFRNGLPHESVLELDVFTGNGEIVTATPDGEHAELFRGFANSYGTLGYATRLRIELEPVRPTVELRDVRFHDLESLVASIGQIVESGEHSGRPVHYLDGVVFSASEAYLVLGEQSERAGPTSDYTGQHIYYRSIQHDDIEPRQDLLTIHDYLWRWDTDWFWCSRAFGAQDPRIRRLWPRRLRRSSVYWKLVALDRRFHIADRLEARRGRPPREPVVQDVEIPLEHTAEFLSWFLDHVPIEPIWLCPLRLRDPSPVAANVGEQPWTLYPLEYGRLYVNVGFWSTVPASPDEVDGHTNRAIESKVTELAGHKSLYSESFYGRDEFDRLYGGAGYTALKRRYDPNGRLLDLYGKAVGNG